MWDRLETGRGWSQGDQGRRKLLQIYRHTFIFTFNHLQAVFSYDVLWVRYSTCTLYVPTAMGFSLLLQAWKAMYWKTEALYEYLRRFPDSPQSADMALKWNSQKGNRGMRKRDERDNYKHSMDFVFKYAFTYLAHLTLYSAQNDYLQNQLCKSNQTNKPTYKTSHGTCWESLIRPPSLNIY